MKQQISKQQARENQPLDRLQELLLDGDQAEAVVEAKKLCAAGVDKQKIVTNGIEEAMKKLDAKCTVEQFSLLEIMLAGRAVTAVIKELFEDSTLPLTKGCVVLASLEGDVHDLGKNIVKTILTAHGYRVVDCGKDCSVEKLVDSAAQEKALAIGISGLITSVAPLVRKVLPMVKERGLENIKILAGGAALKQATSESLNVDYVSENVFVGVDYINLNVAEVQK